MYTEKDIAPYLGLLYLMLEKLGGEFTYSDKELYRVAFGPKDKQIYQYRNEPAATTTIKFAEAVHVEVDPTEGRVEVNGS